MTLYYGNIGHRLHTRSTHAAKHKHLLHLFLFWLLGSLPRIRFLPIEIIFQIVGTVIAIGLAVFVVNHLVFAFIGAIKSDAGNRFDCLAVRDGLNRRGVS